MCSKHVEAWNKLIVKQKNCANWLVTEINVLRCTVSKTSKPITLFVVVEDFHPKDMAVPSGESTATRCCIVAGF